MVPAPETDSASAWCAEARRHLGLAPLDKQSIVDGRDTAALAKDLAGIDKALAGGKLDLSGARVAKLVADWNQAKATALEELRRIKADALKEFPEEASRLAVLDKALAPLDQNLGERLLAAAKLPDRDRRRSAYQDCQATVERYISDIEASPLMKYIETNPFHAFALRESLIEPLARVRNTLGDSSE